MTTKTPRSHRRILKLIAERPGLHIEHAYGTSQYAIWDNDDPDFDKRVSEKVLNEMARAGRFPGHVGFDGRVYADTQRPDYSDTKVTGNGDWSYGK